MGVYFNLGQLWLIIPKKIRKGGFAINGLKIFAAKIAASKWFVAVSGWGFWYSSSLWYDRYAYPALMLYFGIIWGGIIASSVAMLMCATILIIYELLGATWVESTDEIFSDLAKKSEKIADWMKKWEKYNTILKIFLIVPRLIVRLVSLFLRLSIRWISRRGLLGFITLSLIADPFVTISYFKKGRKKSGLTAKDWGLFLLSGIVANVYWILYNSIIVIAIKFAWKGLLGLLT